MDFSLTKEMKDIKQAAREFAQKEFRDIAAECDQQENYPKGVFKKAAELGFVGVFIDEVYGGAGLGFLEHALITEEFWRVDPGLGQQFVSIPFGAEILMLYGTEEQKKKYLPLIPDGKAIMGFAITEPDAGSDAGAGTTYAVLDKEEWILNGSKVMIGNGSSADFMLVFCLTEPDNEKKSGRHSIILVETDRGGYEAVKMHGKMGLRASDTSSIYFKDLRVPKENLIGERGHGFAQLMNFFDRSRAWVGSQGVGLAQGALEMAIEHVKGRKQFGRPLASFQVTQFKIAEMATKIELARTFVHRACWMVDNGELETAIVAMSKWNAGRMAVEVVDEALQLHGGYGYFNDQAIERFYRAAKVLEIYEGTKEVEKIIISRRLLG